MPWGPPKRSQVDLSNRATRTNLCFLGLVVDESRSYELLPTLTVCETVTRDNHGKTCYYVWSTPKWQDHLGKVLRKRDGWVRVCPDDIQLALCPDQPFVKQAESSVWAVAWTRARALLQSNPMVMIDATNLTKKTQSPWRKLAKELGLDIYLMETPFEVCCERNTGTDAVPEDVLRRMNETYQWPTENKGRIIF